MAIKDRIKTFEELIDNYNIKLIHHHFGMIENELVCACYKKKCKFIEHIRTEVFDAKNLTEKLKYYIKYKLIYSKTYFMDVVKKE